MDIDVLKKDIIVILYYVKQEYVEELGTNLKKKSPYFIIQLIIYLNRILHEPETRY